MMADTNLRESYLNWLINIIMPDEDGYKKLITALFETDYCPYFEEDKNRYEDGMSLRYEFFITNEIDEHTAYVEFGNPPCTMLEMMIALAKRMCDVIGETPTVWFKQMLSSLQILYMNDDNLFNKTTFDNVMYTFMTNSYEPNGQGGLFTLEHYMGDIRHIEIWYQMNAFVNEITNQADEYYNNEGV
jgi:hypothetical protein